MMDLPPDQQERIVCSITAAIKYEIPANILLAIAEKEGGKPGQWVKNRNGTHNVGSMQFNTAYLGDLARYGITPSDAAQPVCYPYELGAFKQTTPKSHRIFFNTTADVALNQIRASQF